MSLVWSAIEDAIRAWVLGASGLAESNVVFGEQDASAPAGVYITIRLGDLVRVGGADGLTHTYDDTQALGEEILFASKGPREFTVSIQGFGDETVGDASPRALIERVQSSLALPSRREALNAAGLGVLDEGQVRNISAVYGADFEGRALLEVRFMVMATASERTGYIDTVWLTDLSNNDIRVIH